MSPPLRVLDAHQVKAMLSYRDCIPLVRDAMIAISEGRTRQVLRTILPMGAGNAFGIMPGTFGPDDFFGAKLLGVFADRERPGRSAHRGLVILFEGVDGFPVLAADAEEVTRIRTAAASAAATDALARADAEILALFGCGLQARAHLQAIAAVRRLKRVIAWGRSKSAVEEFIDWAKSTIDVPVIGTTDGAEAAKADIICTVSGAAEPILFNRWIADGTHLNLVGSSRLGPYEVDLELVRRARFFVESRAATAQYSEFQRARDAGLIGDDHIAAEIGEVYGGKAGRARADEVTIYKSIGHVAQDLAAAIGLYRSAAPS